MSYQYIHKPQVRNVYISVYDRLGGSLIEQFSYKELPMKMVIKWGWYFKYRHSLLQIKYPKGYEENEKKSLFPNFTDAHYLKAKKKLNSYKARLLVVENELNDCKNKLIWSLNFGT